MGNYIIITSRCKTLELNKIHSTRCIKKENSIDMIKKYIYIYFQNAVRLKNLILYYSWLVNTR
jgi:hypothetical protein